MQVNGLTNHQLALVLAMENIEHPTQNLMYVEEVADKLERYLNTGTMRR